MKQDKATFSPKQRIHLFSFHRLDVFSRGLNTKVVLDDCLFAAVNLSKNADADKYGYSGYGIVFHARSQLLLPTGEWDKNVVIYGVDSSLSVDADNRKKS